MFKSKFAKAAGVTAVATMMATNPSNAHYSNLDPKIQAEHASFLAVMMARCCDGDEVVVNVTQVSDGVGGYHIVIPPNSYPGQNEKQMVLFTKDKVRTREEIEMACLKKYFNKPEERKTCTPVPLEVNIAFVNPKSFTPYCFLPRFDLG